VRPGKTAFAAPCEACEIDRHEQPAIVQGSLRADADVGFVTCWRGHRVRVKRIISLARTPAAA